MLPPAMIAAELEVEVPVHVLDSEGEVMITLRNANRPFAPYDYDPTDSDSEAETPIDRLRRGIIMSVDVGVLPETFLTPDLRTVTVPAEPDLQGADGTVDGVWVPVGADEPRKLRGMKRTQTGSPDDGKDGDEGDGMVVQFQASAKHLSSASPFFRALLRSGLSESVRFKAEGSVVVSTKQWDADALLYVLKILHCKHHELPRQVDLDMVAKVCVVGDFYGCQDAVRFATQYWIPKLEPVPNNKYRPLLLWLWITYFFRMPALFKEVTSIILTQGKGVIETLGLPIPAPIMAAINTRRREAITDLINHIYDERDRYLTGKLGCSFECGSIMYGGIVKNLTRLRLRPTDGFEAPYHNHSYMSVVRTIEVFQTPRWYDVGSTYSSYGYQYTAHQCHDSTFASLRDGWNGHLDGLELEDFVDLR